VNTESILRCFERERDAFGVESLPKTWGSLLKKLVVPELSSACYTCTEMGIMLGVIYQRRYSRSKMKLNEIKLITTPFLSGLCYGPVHVGVYVLWTFVGLIHLIHRLPLFRLPPLARPLLVLSPYESLSRVVSLLSFSCRCYLLLNALLCSGVGCGCFWRLLR
jgi:hypothetical protein